MSKIRKTGSSHLTFLPFKIIENNRENNRDTYFHEVKIIKKTVSFGEHKF